MSSISNNDNKYNTDEEEITDVSPKKNNNRQFKKKDINGLNAVYTEVDKDDDSNNEDNSNYTDQTTSKPNSLDLSSFVSFLSTKFKDIIYLSIIVVLVYIIILDEKPTDPTTVTAITTHVYSLPIPVVSSTDEGKCPDKQEYPDYIPSWVIKYNMVDLFDWSWHKKSSDYDRYQSWMDTTSSATKESMLKVLNKLPTSNPVMADDAIDYLNNHPNEGIIVDNTAQLSLYPHPLPMCKSLTDTCNSMRLSNHWPSCHIPQPELHEWLPSTQRVITIAIFNSFVDRGLCHGDLPGVIFTPNATFRMNGWSDSGCAAQPIKTFPETVEKEVNNIIIVDEILDSVSVHLSAAGHFAPQQLPRIIRLLAVAPPTAKLLVPTDGVAAGYLDILVERGILDRERILPFNFSTIFSRVVYRAEGWPFVPAQRGPYFVHEKTDMVLVHKALVEDLPVEERNLIILMKRKEGERRSLKEYPDLLTYIKNDLIDGPSATYRSLNLTVAEFTGEGHVREHIALFRRAAIVVGVHGAGFSNVYWPSPGTHIVEIAYNEGGLLLPPMYYQMSAGAGHHYWIVKGYGNWGAPISIDWEDIKWTLTTILNKLKRDKFNREMNS